MNGRWWTPTEKKELSEMLESNNFRYDTLSQKLGRSLFAVQCQVIKWCTDRGIDPIAYGIPASILTKYENKNIKKPESGELFEVLVKSLMHNMDEIRKDLIRLETKIDKMGEAPIPRVQISSI